MKSLMTLPREKLLPIKLLVLDVDGVMTDGRMGYSEDGQEIKFFDVHDGAGLKYWHRAGLQSALLSGKSSPILEHRAKELGISALCTQAKDKALGLKKILDTLKIAREAAAYMGDDLTDIPAMRLCALSLAVGSAVPEVRDFADGVTQHSGGHGAVREAVEFILKAQGKWAQILECYFPPEPPGSAQ
ncbi:MAG: HAD family hydrolase [Planctomycetota bacterium]